MNNCKRCSKDLGYGYDSISQETLSGGIKTSLCNTCGNAWEEYILETEEYQNICILDTKFNVAKLLYRETGMDKFEEANTFFQALSLEIKVATKAVRELSKAWLLEQA